MGHHHSKQLNYHSKYDPPLQNPPPQDVRADDSFSYSEYTQAYQQYKLNSRPQIQNNGFTPVSQTGTIVGTAYNPQTLNSVVVDPNIQVMTNSRIIPSSQIVYGTDTITSNQPINRFEDIPRTQTLTYVDAMYKSQPITEQDAITRSQVVKSIEGIPKTQALSSSGAYPDSNRTVRIGTTPKPFPSQNEIPMAYSREDQKSISFEKSMENPKYFQVE